MKKLVLVVASLMFAAGCGGPQTADPKAGPGVEGGPASQPAGAPADPGAKPGTTPTGGPVAAPSADVSGEILATISASSLDGALKITTDVVKRHAANLPPLFMTMLQPAQIKAQLFKMIEAPALQAMLDTSRPMALALADPKKFKGRKLGPIMLAIPVKDEAQLVDFIAKKASNHETTPWKDHLFTFGTETVRVRFKEGFALVTASDQLMAGAADVLLPLVRKPPKYIAHLSVDMAAINARYGKELDAVIGKVSGKMKKSELDASTTKMVTRWLGYLKGMQEIYVSVDLDLDFIKLRGGARATGAGTFKEFVGKLNAGSLWGAKFLPKDSALVLLTRENTEKANTEIDEAIGTLESMIKKEKELAKRVDAATFKSWKDNLKRGVKNATGVGAAALWATSDGAVGLGGVSQVKDGKAAREDMLAVMKFLSSELARFQNKVFKKELKKALPGFKLSLKVRKNGVRVGGTKGDAFVIGVRWPRLKGKKERADLKKAQKIIAKVLGKKLTIATATHGNIMLMTVGKDFKKRLAQMLAIAKGKKPASQLQAKLKPYVAGRQAVNLVYTPLETLAEQTMRVVENVTKVPPQVKDTMAKVMPGPDVEVPATGLAYRDGNTFAFESRISTQVVGMVVRGVLHAMMKRGGPPPRP